MTYPKQITEEKYNKLRRSFEKKASRWARKTDNTGTGVFYSDELVVCGLPQTELPEIQKAMNRLNTTFANGFRVRTDVVHHLMTFPCTKVTTFPCPETMVECLAKRQDGTYWYHRHAVGECWFRVYPHRPYECKE